LPVHHLFSGPQADRGNYPQGTPLTASAILSEKAGYIDFLNPAIFVNGIANNNDENKLKNSAGDLKCFNF